MNLTAALADLLGSARSLADCTRRQVGAVLVSPEGFAVASGYNRMPSGSCSLGECPRGRLSYDELPASSAYTGNCTAVHAERMALRRAGERAQGATCYVTATPCPWCADALALAGVTKVVVVSLAPELALQP